MKSASSLGVFGYVLVSSAFACGSDPSPAFEQTNGGVNSVAGTGGTTASPGGTSSAGTFGVGPAKGGQGGSFTGVPGGGGSLSGAGGKGGSGGSGGTGGTPNGAGGSVAAGCPATQPANESTCSAAGPQACSYAGTACECVAEEGEANGAWQCAAGNASGCPVDEPETGANCPGAAALSCPYDDLTCTCAGQGQTWSCQQGAGNGTAGSPAGGGDDP